MRKRIAFTVTWKRLVAIGAILAVLPFAVSLSGLVSIAASSGHFAPVGWFLHWTMQNVVDRQSLGVSVPEDVDLADPALVQRAAGHFATGCAPCHGAPGVPQSPVVLSMTPHPPRLETQVGEWKDRELFWIGLNGIKYSGMPAWPTQTREDEVWAQVAFLRALPDMSPEAYADLSLGGDRPTLDVQAGGEQTAGLNGIVSEALADCARCHGRDGMGVGTGERAKAFPLIAGQSEAYLFASLQAFARGDRHSGFMQPPASRYSEEILAELARHYANQPRATGGDVIQGLGGIEGIAVEAERPQRPRLVASTDGIPPQIFPEQNRSEVAIADTAAAGSEAEQDEAQRLELGRLLAEEGIAARKIPACDSCHATQALGKNPLYPYLAGQPAWYIETHLHLWKEEERGGTRFSHLMEPIARHMTDDHIEAVATWYASRPLGE